MKKTKIVMDLHISNEINEKVDIMPVGADASVRPLKWNNQKGITLLALIITIIVLLILAMVSIKLITNHNVIEYAKKATSQYGEEQSKEKENLDLLAKKMNEISGTDTDDNIQQDPDKNHEEPQDGDTITIGDFEYNYDTEKANGWECFPTDATKESYGKICETVYGKPVVGADFEECENLKVAPYLPKYLNYFNFKGCTSLTTVVNIPDSVASLANAFLNCTSLTGTIVINANPENISGCFSGTILPIELTGTSKMLSEIAATANNNNVTVKK